MKRVLATLLCLLLPASSYGWVIQHTIPSGGGSPACASGGELGTTTRNSSAGYAQNRFQYSNFPEGTTGEITHCWARFNNVSTGQGVTIGVYETDGTVLAYHNFTSGGTAEAWQGGELNTPVCLADSTYIVGMVTQDTGWNFFFDTSETGVDRLSIAMTYGATLSDADFSSPTVHNTNTAYMIVCNDTGVSP